MSESTDTQQEHYAAAVPSWIKIGLIALVVIVIVSIVIFFTSGDSDDSTEVTPSVDATPIPSENVLAKPLNMGGAEKINSSSLLAIEDLPGTNLETELVEQGEEILAIQENSKINNKQISLILEQLKKLQTEFNLGPAQHATQEVAIKNINASIATIEETLAKQAEIYAKKTKAKKNYKRKVYRTPPFVLVSIDQWGSDTTAIVRYQNQLQELRQGQSLTQWRVKSINMVSSTATFSHTSGASKTLHIKS